MPGQRFILEDTMAWEWVTEPFKAMIGRMPVLLTILGFLLVVGGLSAGIPYHNWLPINGQAPRLASAGLGIALILAGYFREKSKPDLLQKEDYDIKIGNPKDGDFVSVVSVRGTIKEAIPEGYSLKVLRIRPTDKTFVPIGEASIDIAKHTWVAEDCKIWGEPKEKWIVGVYLVGRDGSDLMDYFSDAVRVHSRVLNDLKGLSSKKPEYLPALKRPTSDMIECDRVTVIGS
jgi:hypothetical protein